MTNIRKKKWKKHYWLLVIPAATILLIVLALKHRPGSYAPPELPRDKRVSPYLTNELLPTLYNKSQLREPFEVVITEEGINDIISRCGWPMEMDTTTVSSPQALLQPEQFVFMATTTTKGVDLVATIEIAPAIDANGLMNIHIASISLGAVNLTSPIKAFVADNYGWMLIPLDDDDPDITVLIGRSLLYDKPFQPIFTLADRRLKLQRISVERGKIRVSLMPLPN